jgi:hypothetical protein
MARIVGIHGVGHQFGGEETTGSSWLSGLRDGLRRNRVAEAALPTNEDFALAFYGDLYRHTDNGDPLERKSWVDAAPTQEWERKLLAAFCSEVEQVNSETIDGATERKLIATPQSVQAMLRFLSRSRFFSDMAMSALLGDLKQTRLYLNNQAVKDEAQRRLLKLITPETRVVIAHSLGSIVAYETLCKHGQELPMFITLGSPLGITNFIFDKLDPTPKHGIGTYPPGLASWTNIADQGDVVALVKQLAGKFGGRIDDMLVNNGARAHDASRYLTTSEVGTALALGLGLL